MTDLRSNLRSKVFVLLYIILLIVLFAWGTRYRSSWLYGGRMWFDGAGNLQVPYNLVVHGKYGSNPTGKLSGQRPSNIKEFNPITTTGPAVLLPIAGLYSLKQSPIVRSGRQFVFWCLVFCMLFMTGYVVYRTRNPVPGILMAYLISRFPNIKVWNHVSNEVLGEAPGVAYFCLGTAFVYCIPHKRLILLFVGGLAFGCAIQSKLVMALAVFGAAIHWLAERFLSRSKIELKEIAVVASGILLPTAAFELWQFLSVGSAQYLELKASLLRAFGGLSGGAVSTSSLGSSDWWVGLSRRSSTAWNILTSQPVLLGTIFLGLVFWIKDLFSKQLRDNLSSVVLLSGLIYVFWFIFLSGGGWPRHFVPGGALLILGTSSYFCLTANDWLKAKTFRFLSFSTKEIRIAVLCFIGLGIAITSIRLSKNFNTTLADQERLWLHNQEIDREHQPYWIAQNNNTFNSLIHLTPEIPIDAFLIDVRNHKCHDPGFQPHLKYALLWKRAEREKYPHWKCTQSIVSDPGNPQYGFDLCQGKDLICTEG